MATRKQRKTHQIVHDWAHYAEKDMSDKILAIAFHNGALLDSLRYFASVTSNEVVEVTFSYYLYGAFVDMGVGRKGFGAFYPRLWYSPIMGRSFQRLNHLMLSRYGAEALAQIVENLPKKVNVNTTI